jgi:tetratricopeptide (TPR) repeat protein
MKSTLLTLLSVLTLYTSCKSQPKATENTNDMKLINSIFDKVEVQGVDTKQNLLYGYFFFDKDKPKLEKLKNELTKQFYKFVELDKKDNGEFMLQVEKVEQHTRQTLYDREQKLRQLAANYSVSSFDGFDVGNADPTKPLVSNDNFLKFMTAKKGNDLFNLGIKLYDLEINDKAVIVFKECIKQNIKPDTSAYKLGNTLIGQNKIEDGINQLEQATKFNPNYLSAFFNLGATCYDNMQFQKSIQYYQQADKLKPNDDRIIYGIAASQYAVQQFDKSLENCKKALQLNKDNENAKQLLQMLKGKTN